MPEQNLRMEKGHSLKPDMLPRHISTFQQAEFRHNKPVSDDRATK